MSQLMVMFLSLNLHAYMVKAPAPPKPEMAADGTQIVELMPYDELMKRTPDEIEAYMEVVSKAVLYYEEHVGQYVMEDARAHVNWRRWLQSVIADEAEAAFPPVNDLSGSNDPSRKAAPERPKTKTETTPASATTPTRSTSQGRPETTKAAPKTPVKGFAPEGYDPKIKADFRCFNAGWPVTKSVCKAEDSAQWTYDSGGFGKTATTTLKCADGGTLCNPIVFGVVNGVDKASGKGVDPATGAKRSAKPDAERLADKAKEASVEPIPGPLNTTVKPVCISPSEKRNPSRACYYKAKDLGAKRDVKNNKKLYEQYEAGFKAMCGKDGVSKNAYYERRKGAQAAIDDMKNTCRWIHAAVSGEFVDGKYRKSESPDAPAGTGK